MSRIFIEIFVYFHFFEKRYGGNKNCLNQAEYEAEQRELEENEFIRKHSPYTGKSGGEMGAESGYSFFTFAS